jgi:hypothetical protein
MADKKKSEPMKEFVVARYGNTADFEAHLNQLDDEGETAFNGRFVVVTYKLHTFSIDSRDGTIVAVYHRGV